MTNLRVEDEVHVTFFSPDPKQSFIISLMSYCYENAFREDEPATNKSESLNFWNFRGCRSELIA